MINNTYCPGVYTSVKKNITAPLADAVFIAAAAQSGNSGEVVTLYNEESCVSVFGNAGEGYILSALVKAALNNGAKKVYAVKCGNSNDYLAAFDSFQNTVDAVVLVCDSTDTEILKALNNTVNTRSLSSNECFAVMGVTSDVPSDLRNERTVFVSQGSETDEITSVFITASAVAGRICEACNQLKNLNLCKLDGINKEDAITPVTADSLISNGITPIGLMGQNAITRCVSSFIQRGVLDINSIIICDRVIKGARQRLNTLFEGEVFPTYSSIESCLIVFMESMVESGDIICYKRPLITQNANDSTICDISLSFTSAQGINQIRLFAEASV